MSWTTLAGALEIGARRCDAAEDVLLAGDAVIERRDADERHEHGHRIRRDQRAAREDDVALCAERHRDRSTRSDPGPQVVRRRRLRRDRDLMVEEDVHAHVDAGDVRLGGHRDAARDAHRVGDEARRILAPILEAREHVEGDVAGVDDELELVARGAGGVGRDGVARGRELEGVACLARCLEDVRGAALGEGFDGRRDRAPAGSALELGAAGEDELALDRCRRSGRRFRRWTADRRSGSRTTASRTGTRR